MAKKKTPKSRKKPNHPTLFVLDGSVRNFDGGTMFELHTQINMKEWSQIVKETIQYKVFVDCLKEVAFPILKERWTKEDDWWRLQMNGALSRMRNIDPLLYASFNQEEVKAAFSKKIKENAETVVKDIKLLRETQNQFFTNDGVTEVSDL
jgi:hypothetical protein